MLLTAVQVKTTDAEVVAVDCKRLIRIYMLLILHQYYYEIMNNVIRIQNVQVNIADNITHHRSIHEINQILEFAPMLNDMRNEIVHIIQKSGIHRNVWRTHYEFVI